MLLVDIGGGSTELVIGERGETLAARSFKLGAVRLTDRFFPGGSRRPKAIAPLPPVRARRARATSSATSIEHGFDVAVGVVGHGRGGRPDGPRGDGRRAAAHVQLLRVHDAGAGRRRRRAGRPPDGIGARQGARARGRPRRHRRRRGAHPRDAGDDVRCRAVHLQRGGAARRCARRHGRADARRRRRATTSATCRAAASVSSSSVATTTRRTRRTSPASPSSCSTPSPHCTGSTMRRGSTWRPAPCSPTSASSSPTASTTCTPTTWSATASWPG